MSFLFGILGAFGCIALFCGGVFAGYKLREKLYQYGQKTTAEALSAEERQKLIEEQEAFHELSHYNVETAYQVKDTAT